MNNKTYNYFVLWCAWIAYYLLWYFISVLFLLTKFTPKGVFDWLFVNFSILDKVSCTKINNIWILGEADSVQFVKEMVDKLIKHGLLLNETTRLRIVCTRSKGRLLAFDRFYIGQFVVFGEYEPKAIIFFYKLLLRKWAKERGIGFFKWDKAVRQEQDRLWEDALRIRDLIYSSTGVQLAEREFIIKPCWRGRNERGWV